MSVAFLVNFGYDLVYASHGVKRRPPLPETVLSLRQVSLCSQVFVDPLLRKDFEEFSYRVQQAYWSVCRLVRGVLLRFL
jgi:hypothetical protein